MGEPISVGIVTVATNRYVDYWARLATSTDQHLFTGHEVVLHVFTDRPDAVERHRSSLGRVRVNPIAIAPLTWPEATLLRYEVFTEHHEHLTQDVLIHLDADMLVSRDTGSELSPTTWIGGMALVRHPGYRRPTSPLRLELYSRHPGIAARDVYSELRFGGIGRWETRKESMAFVPRNLRSTYVCGGTWMGLREPFLNLCSELSERTRADLDAGLIAVWHDESHLNWYASQSATTILDSSYCYAVGLPGLRDLEAAIIAVDKSDDRTR